MNPRIQPSSEPARALATSTTAAEAVRERAIATLRTSIDRILVMRRECEDPARKIRLNATLFAATRELAAMLRA